MLLVPETWELLTLSASTVQCWAPRAARKAPNYHFIFCLSFFLRLSSHLPSLFCLVLSSSLLHLSIFIMCRNCVWFWACENEWDMVPFHNDLLSEQVEIMVEVMKWRRNMKVNAMRKWLAEVQKIKRKRVISSTSEGFSASAALQLGLKEWMEF